MLKVEQFLRFFCDRPVRLLSCGQFVGRKDFIHARRILDNHCLIIGLGGALHIGQAGGVFDTGAGDMLLLRAGEEHAGSAPSPGARYYWCHFTCPPGAQEALLDRAEAVESYYLMKRGMAAQAQRTVLLPEQMHLARSDRANVLFRQMMDNANGEFYTRCVCDYAMTGLLFELTQQAADSFYRDFSGQPRARYSEALEWVRLHAGDALTVREVADRFGYNANYLSGLVRARTGYSLGQYIQKTRIDRARDLLTGSDRTIHEIALGLGFQDEKYFMRLFKKLEGVTPTQYKNAFTLLHLNDR